MGDSAYTGNGDIKIRIYEEQSTTFAGDVQGYFDCTGIEYQDFKRIGRSTLKMA